MAAATLQTKKAVNKGKIKKVLKNVVCRPDPVFWPHTSDSQKLTLESALNKYKVEIPQFKKPHWKELRTIPKDKRPKPPKIKKIEGFLFGTSECCNAIKNSKCAAIIIEASVNPRAIVQPVMEACINSRVPVICVNGLRSLCSKNFGIPTSSLGIQCDCLPDLLSCVLDISKHFKLPEVTTAEKSIEMKEDTDVEMTSVSTLTTTTCAYLYRTSKKERVFNPSNEAARNNNITDFSGQDFIEFNKTKEISHSVKIDRKSYMKMILKKISNNPKRAKV